MLAIHNYRQNLHIHRLAANAFAKLSKCQQFTTTLKFIFFSLQLQTLLQSYQNVSNSQRLCKYITYQHCCKRFCKVIKMLAIHNLMSDNPTALIAANAFAKLSKCQQFTTIILPTYIIYQLQTLLQSYQNVSNSQLGDTY